MNYAIILSGGIGTRMQMGSFPKQYLEVGKETDSAVYAGAVSEKQCR